MLPTHGWTTLSVAGLLAASTALGLLAPPATGARQEAQQETQLEAGQEGQAVTEPVPAGTAGPGVSTSERCARCHSASPNAIAMRDAENRPIAPYDLWQSTMMANSARDPFWRAVMSAEVAATPNAGDEIKAECMKCHAPLADQVGLEEHGTGDVAHALDCDGELGDMARDGASCTICHGIDPANLGSDESFNAGFKINDKLELYGPHDEVFFRPMQNIAGFTPVWSGHVTQSKLCGTCHTLSTETRDAEGEVTGSTLHEQTPYLEWRNSAFSNEEPDGSLKTRRAPGARTCQACHMPTMDEDRKPIETLIAHNPGGFDFPFLEPRSPFGRHLLVGGNAFMLTMLRDNAELLKVVAPRSAFDATIDATRDQLENRTARVAIEGVRQEDGELAFDVVVTNFAGHKLPTGHPSRRMWLEVVAHDFQGNRILASGRIDDEGRIIGGGDAVLATESRGGPIEPHRDEVTGSNEVARYRAVMEDDDGNPSFVLLRGATWAIDDRILPRGWEPDHPDADRARPYGTEGDADYEPERRASGSDRVKYRIKGVEAPAATVRVRLLYQSVSPRYVDEIAAFKTPEIERFIELYENADRSPEVLATTVWSAPF